MPKIKEREYRYYSPLAATTGEKRIDSSFYVEGYATTFNRYELFEINGRKFYEEIAPDALSGADMSDVIMQYDHTGRVLARQSNGTLGVEADSKGLFIFADLSGSDAAQALYNDITKGLVTKMSWAFTIAEESFNEDTSTWTIKKIRKVYDVSAVSIPANGDTDISARGLERRSYVTDRQERLGLRARQLALKIRIGGKNHESRAKQQAGAGN